MPKAISKKSMRVRTERIKPRDDCPERVKVIILVTGSETRDLYVTNVAPPGAAPVLGLTPIPPQPAGFVYTPTSDLFSAPPSAAPA